MKYLLPFLLLLTIIVGCTPINEESSTNNINGHPTPNYHDFKNSWEEDKIYGKVKTLEHHTSFAMISSDTPTLEYRKTYNELGFITNKEYVDYHGEILYASTFDYNEDNNLVKITNTFPSEGDSITTSSSTMTYDSKQRNTATRTWLGDKIISTSLFQYNTQGDIIEIYTKSKNDTIVTNIDYSYSDTLTTIQTIETYLHKPHLTTNMTESYKYDGKGNLTESNVSSSNIALTKVKYEYNKNAILTSTTEYESGFLKIKTKFNDFFNETEILRHQKSEAKTLIQYEYKYDEKNNWIQKNVVQQQLIENVLSPSFQKVETRKLEYYP